MHVGGESVWTDVQGSYLVEVLFPMVPPSQCPLFSSAPSLNTLQQNPVSATDVLLEARCRLESLPVGLAVCV